MSPKTFRVEHIFLNGEQYEYEWHVGGVKRLNLRIRPDGSIRVSTPLGVSTAQREQFLQANAPAIVRAVQRAKQKQAKQVDERSGKITHLGREIFVRVISAPPGQRKKAVCKVDDDQMPTELVVSVKGQQEEQEQRLLVDKAVREWEKGRLVSWVRACHQATILDLFSDFSRRRGEPMHSFVLNPTEFRVRDMKSRWASCNTKTGVLSFYRGLIRFPASCIEYVLVHEFAHFLQPDHSPAFHALMTELMPDWRQRRKQLNQR
ncbi:MAG: M48 family metallopeptidase [Clostridia bacterium]|nr:M48 family metallopeptidase [Clostridia bacterium]